MLKKNIDYLVLGCSHYPFLILQIKNILGNKVQIIDSGEAVAKQTKMILQKNNLLYKGTSIPKHLLFGNANIDTLKKLANNLNKKCLISYLDF